jgi:hypothetical protein
VRVLGKALLAAMVVAGVMVAGGPGASAEEVSGVYGFVWLDRDGGGGSELWELPRVGVEVTIQDVATGVERTAVTDFQGEFRLDELPFGEYDVTADDAGYRSVLPRTQRVELDNPRPRGTYFPQQGARIWGRAWDDVNADGVRQAGEPGRQAPFTLFGQSDADGGPFSLTVQADADGRYEMWDLPSGTYQISTTSPSGMVATQYRAAGAQWYTDSDFLGAAEPTTEPFDLWVAWSVANIDVGFAMS